MKTIYPALGAIGLLALMVLPGCGTPPAPVPTAAPTAATSVPPAVTAPAAKATAVPPATAAPAATAATASLQPITFPQAAGLERLDHYQYTFKIAFNGTRDGQKMAVETTYSRVWSRESKAQFSTIDTSNQDGKPVRLLFGSIGEAHYYRAGPDAPCEVGWGKPGSAEDELDPVTLLVPVRQAQPVGKETVNGVPSLRYAVDARAFASAAGATVKGELSMAETGGYVTKYVLGIKGDESYWGKGLSGERTLDFEVRNAGVRQAVAPPAGCPAPQSDLPALPDAANVERTPWGIRYTTPARLEQVAAFYRERMKALGWELKSSFVQDTQLNSLVFALARERKVLFIRATQQASGLSVEARVIDEPAAQPGR